MTRYPGAVWRPVGNFGYPRGTRGQLRPVAIVDHIAQGTMAGIDAWFSNPTSEASAHFAVGKLGQVHQYVDLEDAAWANGKKNRPDNTIPWMAVANPNLVTVSIEHEGYTGEAWTEAMYAADLALHRWLVGIFNIPVDDNHIIGHYRIDSVNRARCPGMGWPKARLFQDLEEGDMDRAQFNKWWGENWGKYVGDPPKVDGKDVAEPIGHINRYLRGGYPRLQKNVAVAAAKGGVLTALVLRVKTLEQLKNPCNFGTDHATMGERMGQYRTAIKALQKELAALEVMVDAHAARPHDDGGYTDERVKAIIKATRLSPG